MLLIVLGVVALGVLGYALWLLETCVAYLHTLTVVTSQLLDLSRTAADRSREEHAVPL